MSRKLVCLIILVLVPTAGAQTLIDFFSDDFLYVVGNDELRSISLWKPWVLLEGPTNPFEFLPVRDLSYRVDMALFGLWPVGYRIHNLLLYALCGLAAWLLTREVLARLEVDRRRGTGAASAIAVLATALFLVHPADGAQITFEN